MEDHLLFHMLFNLPLHLAPCVIWWLWLPSDRNISVITVSVNMNVFLCSHLVPQLSVTSPHNCVLFHGLYILACLSHAACYLEAAGLPWIHLHTAPVYYTQQFCLLHIFSPYRRIPPVIPHMQQIKILFSNCCIQHHLMCSLMMDQECPTHVGVQCFKKYYCELNDICVHLLVEFVETEQYKISLKYQKNCAILYSNTHQKTLLKKNVFVFSEIHLI